jgi:FADH2 O2-dependent halogenase
MVKVPTFQREQTEMPVPWELSTLHHCFERGWFWVIPFNNHPGSTNPLISVGLTIDPRRYPRTGPPEKEFGEFLECFPSVAEQFEDARAVRPWVSTGRLQYSSKNTTGYRYCLMSHASGFVDPLFSRGMVNSIEVISALIEPLLNSLATDNFDLQAYKHIDRLQDRVLNYNDNLVNGSFISWDDFELWNAWLRVWSLGTILAEFRLMNALNEYTKTRDEKYLKSQVKDPIFSDYEDPDYGEFFMNAVEWIEAYERRELSAAETSKRIFDHMAQFQFPVMITREAFERAGWLKPGQNMTDANVELVRSTYRWAMTHPQTRDLFGRFETLCRWAQHQPDPHIAKPAMPRSQATMQDAKEN